MAHSQIEDERIQLLNKQDVQPGGYVLYWMQQSQRAEYNHALEYAVQRANDLQQPVVVCFGLMADYPGSNLRHYTFMLEGLQDTEQALIQRGIKFVMRYGNPDQIALELGKEASLVVCDRGYLRFQRQWRDNVAQSAPCQVVQVESEVVVPVETASVKANYAARTIRPRIHRHLDRFLIPFASTPVQQSSLNLDLKSLDLSNIEAVLAQLPLDCSVPPVSSLFQGGTTRAKQILEQFLRKSFAIYTDHRNQPQTDDVSYMSQYLHFGQISPLYLALQIQSMGNVPRDNVDTYIEELIVRRELAMNFTHYTPDYDAYSCLPNWAQTTLDNHRHDPRIPCYSLEQLDESRTEDPYWNAAMAEMKHTGYMHNYMRMYWGKKIIEWTATPELAFQTALDLNNKYFIDGRDANSYTGVAWVFGVHDRGWRERPIFGTVRYMAASGLKRKCDIDGYIKKVNQRVKSLNPTLK
ncbi:deoxyribodipyrimidine photo-lyase [Acaryochloris sp. 'Moss Beach']|uniref:deoxyribodipyrimidine photo-lyase n=1 Tax=Acaryochloris sp. 'Moss Beach' TaxID=2740837 RepID=UPI001F208D0C|nr:deoxyribodipyrimidine photo-lyase [Acaryochloris sp. 'Moss Beach']UJB69868.1 deoxyribodipyrimidine photo-lyase [Acaryochloris sp. 'Moss Beach']